MVHRKPWQPPPWPAQQSHLIPPPQEPTAEGGRIHGVLRLRSGATVDALVGPTWARNIMTAATRDFTGLTLSS